MEALDKPRERFAAIVDTLTEAALADLPNLGTDLLIRAARSESQKVAELERELRGMRRALPNGRVIFTPDFEALSEFAEANGLGLEDIQFDSNGTNGRVTGLQSCGRWISDIGRLACLTSLKELVLPRNKVQDISALSGLTSLEKLILGENQIEDISALAGLTSLIWLELEKNRIQNVSALSGLTALRTLHLNENQIQDVSALSGLAALKALHLHRNQITDISVLPGLTSLQWVAINKPESLESSTGDRFDDQIAVLRSRSVAISIGDHVYFPL